MIRHTTERLQLREFNEADAPFIHVLLNDPGWLECIGDRNIDSTDAAARYLRTGPIASYAEHGFGLYMVELREGSEPIGMCGLLKRQTFEYPDLGFAFLESQSGHGYATESSRAVLEHAFTERGMSEVLAITSMRNEASIRVLEKIGFVFEQMVKPKRECDDDSADGADDGHDEELIRVFRCVKPIT